MPAVPSSSPYSAFKSRSLTIMSRESAKDSRRPHSSPCGTHRLNHRVCFTSGAPEQGLQRARFFPYAISPDTLRRFPGECRIPSE